MDISSIIADTLTDMSEKYDNLNGFSFDSSNPQESKKAMFLREYSENLLENYHKALSLELSKQGIHI